MQALGLVWNNVDPLTADLDEVRKELSEPTQFGAKLLLEHWKAKQAEDGFVVGRDVPSRALSCVLRNLALFEPVDDMSDFRVRLAGTAFMRRFGRDITGLKFSEIYTPGTFASRRAGMRDVIGDRKPCVIDAKLTRGTRTFLHFEAVRLPVWAPDREAAWVLDGLFCFDWP